MAAVGGAQGQYQQGYAGGVAYPPPRQQAQQPQYAARGGGYDEPTRARANDVAAEDPWLTSLRGGDGGAAAGRRGGRAGRPDWNHDLGADDGFNTAGSLEWKVTGPPNTLRSGGSDRHGSRQGGTGSSQGSTAGHYTPSNLDATAKKREGLERLKRIQSANRRTTASRGPLQEYEPEEDEEAYRAPPPARRQPEARPPAQAARGRQQQQQQQWDYDEYQAPAPVGRPKQPAQAARAAPPAAPRAGRYEAEVSRGMGGLSLYEQAAEADAGPADSGDLVECQGCGRSFNPKAYQVHRKVCAKVFQSKRKQFNALQKMLPAEAKQAAASGSKMAAVRGGAARAAPAVRPRT